MTKGHFLRNQIVSWSNQDWWLLRSDQSKFNSFIL